MEQLRELVPWIYFLAAITFILGLKGLSGPTTAQMGNRIAAGGMLLAVVATFLESQGRLVRLGEGLAVGAPAYEEAKRLLLDESERTGSITLARFRDLIGGGRKQAQLLLERFDADGLTRRVGDERVLRRKARSG